MDAGKQKVRCDQKTMQIVLHFSNGSHIPVETENLNSVWSLRQLISEDNRLMEERIQLLRENTVLYDDDTLEENDQIQVRILPSSASKRPRVMEQ
jgi:hypothetical protein